MRTHRWAGAVTAAIVASVLMSGCDFAQFGFLPSHQRHTPDAGITTANAPAVVPHWRASSLSAASSPAIVGGKVYVGSLGGVHVFDADGVTNCVDMSCDPLWIANTTGPVNSSPAVDDGRFFVGSNDDKVYAFDAAGITNCTPGFPPTCEPLWTATTGGDVDASPTVSDGIVYIGSSDGKLYAFDAAGVTNCSGTPTTCDPLWTGGTGGPVHSSAAVGHGRAIVGSDDGNLYAFDAAGAGNCTGTPTTCEPLWTGVIGGFVRSSPAMAWGKVFVGASAGFGSLYVFDESGTTNCSAPPTTCQPLWQGFTSGDIVGSPAIARNHVYIGSLDGSLYSFHRNGGPNCAGTPIVCQAIGIATTGESIESSPVIAGPNLLYITSDDGTLYAFDSTGISGCTSCLPLWTAELTGVVQPMASSPAVADGEVYVVASDGQLHALRPLFGAPASYGTGPSINGAAGDFDGDADTDLAMTTFGGHIGVVLNNGDGTFAAIVTYDSSDPGESSDTSYYVAVGDFDGTNGLDLAVTNNASDKLAILLNDGNATFAAPVNYEVPFDSHPTGVAVGDLDGANGPDVVVAGQLSGQAWVFLNAGDGSFAAAVSYAAGTQPIEVLVEDLDGVDGPDLAVTNAISNDVSVLLNNGDGTFASAVDYNVGNTPSGVAAGDFDGVDGPDLAVTNGISNDVSVLLNNGDGSFATTATIPVGGSPRGVAVGDFDGDTDLDLAASLIDANTVALLRNDGTGTFSADLHLGGVGDTRVGIVATDVDGDTKADLAVSGFPGVAVARQR